MDLLGGIPYLQKKSAKLGLSYLQQLRLVLNYPIMGNNLTDLGSKLCPIVDIGVSDEDLLKTAIVMQILEGVEKMDEAVWKIPSSFFTTDAGEWLQSLNFVLEGVSPNQNLWRKDSFLYNVASEEQMGVNGWKQNLPHPASMAATWLAYKSYSSEMRGLPGFTQEVPDSYTSLMMWLKSVGKIVGSVLPKDAEALLPTAGNLGAEFIRHEISIYWRIISNIRNNKAAIEGFTKWKVKIDIQSDPQSGLFGKISDFGECLMSSESAIRFLLQGVPSIAIWNRESPLPVVTTEDNRVAVVSSS